MADFFAKFGILTEEKLDWKCSTCRRKFCAKCNVGSHIAQSSCKRKSATVEFIGVKNEPPKNIPIVNVDEYINNILCSYQKPEIIVLISILSQVTSR